MYIQYVDPEMPGIQELIDQVLSVLDVDEDSWLIFDLTVEKSWKMGLYSEKTGVLGLGNETAGAGWMKHSCPSGAAEMKDGRDASVCERVLPETVFGPEFTALFGSQAVISRETIILLCGPGSVWYGVCVRRRPCGSGAGSRIKKSGLSLCDHG